MTSFLAKIKSSIQSTSTNLAKAISSLFKIQTEKHDIIQDLEDILVMHDIGYKTARKIIAAIPPNIVSDGKAYEKDVMGMMYESILSTLTANEIIELTERYRVIPKNLSRPYVILVCGVNGTGKTTTAAKLAYLFQKQQYRVLLGACDTFRAAAKEQLEEWSKVIGCKIVGASHNSEPASVAHNAYNMAKDNNYDIVIIDTAGRLHNNTDMMNELQKCIRVLNKIDPSTPDSITLVLDATVGQNAISQTENFSKIIPINNIIVTKVDSTAKAGILVNIVDNYRVPILYVGTGEKLEDLYLFDAVAFTKSLLDMQNT